MLAAVLPMTSRKGRLGGLSGAPPPLGGLGGSPPKPPPGEPLPPEVNAIAAIATPLQVGDRVLTADSYHGVLTAIQGNDGRVLLDDFGEELPDVVPLSSLAREEASAAPAGDPEPPALPPAIRVQWFAGTLEDVAFSDLLTAIRREGWSLRIAQAQTRKVPNPNFKPKEEYFAQGPEKMDQPGWLLFFER